MVMMMPVMVTRAVVMSRFRLLTMHPTMAMSFMVILARTRHIVFQILLMPASVAGDRSGVIVLHVFNMTVQAIVAMRTAMVMSSSMVVMVTRRLVVVLRLAVMVMPML